MTPNADLFWAKVDKSGECWEWTGSRRHTGYGRFAIRRQIVGAHRASWLLNRGPIPAGLSVCHHCDNPPCVRPDHLFLGTNAENLADMRAKGRARGGVLLHPRGTAHPNAKLTEAIVVGVREALRRGETQTAVARQLGVTQSLISQVASRRLWAHVA